MNNKRHKLLISPIRKLPVEETSDPFLVIKDLFDYARLSELKEMHWEFFKSAVSGLVNGEESKNCLEYLFFYEQIEKLLEAAHLIFLNRQSSMRS